MGRTFNHTYPGAMLWMWDWRVFRLNGAGERGPSVTGIGDPAGGYAKHLARDGDGRHDPNRLLPVVSDQALCS